jgi:uncharacterized protein YhbP (UPF0306 family)
MYFAVLSSHTIVVMSPPATRHMSAIEIEPMVSIAVFDSTQSFDGLKRGLQIEGDARRMTTDEDIDDAIIAYCGRFPSARNWMSSRESLAKIDSRPYLLSFTLVKIFDEPSFGPDRWVTAVWNDD